MKRIFLLFAITLVAISGLSVSCDSSISTKVESPKRQGWDDFPLYGDVESVTMTSYQFKNEFGNFIPGDIESCEKFYFNAAGDVVEEARYNSNGSLVKAIYKYNSKGNIIKVAGYSDGSLVHKRKYNSKGNIIKEAWYSDGGWWHVKGGGSTYKYKYDSTGNMIEQAEYSIIGGSLVKKYIYKYDKNGNMIETTTYDSVDYMVDFETKTNYIETFIPRSRTVLEISYRN